MRELWDWNFFSPSTFCLQKKAEATVEQRGLNVQCAEPMTGQILSPSCISGLWCLLTEECCSTSGLFPICTLVFGESNHLTVHYGSMTCTIFPKVIKTHDTIKQRVMAYILPNNKMGRFHYFSENKRWENHAVQKTIKHKWSHVGQQAL